MNKLRSIKIYELKGNVHPIEAFVINLLERVDIVLNDHRKLFKLSDISYLVYNNINKDVWLVSEIFDLFYYDLKCSYNETIVIMKYLLEKHLKLEINEVR